MGGADTIYISKVYYIMRYEMKILDYKSETDVRLKELDDEVPQYIKDIGSFQYENNTYTLVNHYRSEVYLSCQICAHERIIDVYVIKDQSGKLWNVGNVCIEQISNHKIGEWFKSYSLKRNNIENNRELLDFASDFIGQYDWHGKFPIKHSNLERVRTALERMRDGKNPTDTQISLIRYYIRNKSRYF